MSNVNVTDTSNCTAISPQCPLDQTIYGYYPNLGVNAFFTALFGILLVAQLFQGIKWKARSFMIALGFGCLGETVGNYNLPSSVTIVPLANKIKGYAGRVILHGNPWSSTGFNMQIVCLIIAPAFLSAGIYLTLKHIVLTVGQEYSRLQAKYYTWIFILCDLLSLTLQGAGGGLAATSNTTSGTKLGNNLMMAGIVFQVVTFMVFGILASLYAKSAYQNRKSFSRSTVALLSSTGFMAFIFALSAAYTAIFIRCVYRIAEMARGWSNPIMQNQTEFIVLDGV